MILTLFIQINRGGDIVPNVADQNSRRDSKMSAFDGAPN